MSFPPSTGVPTNLRVNNMRSPLGIPACIYFGWHLSHPEPNQKQTRYQILVASTQAELDQNVGELWDSGMVTSRAQNYAAYAGAPLASNTTYFWKVRFWDRDGNASRFSKTAVFRVGLLTNDDWAGAAWIRRETDDADDYTYYRKRIDLRGGEIERATLYISSVHKYELYLNGGLVGNGPSYHYPQYQYYNTYDVTAQLVIGAQNVLAVFNHWFGAGQGRPASARGVLAKLIVEYVDGTLEWIGTDAIWKQKRAEAWRLGQPPRNEEGVGYVECIDAAKLVPDWFAPDFDDAAWENAVEIGAQPTAPWMGNLQPDFSRIVESVIVPTEIVDKGNGTYVVDLGSVYAGRPRLEFPQGHTPALVTVCGGYALDANGLVDAHYNQVTDMTYLAQTDGAAITILPCEYLGMRYVQIDNAPMLITRGNFSFVQRHADLDAARSAFTSSDPTLNAVWELCKRSLFLGAQEQFLDTPTREKGGFLVDSMNESIAAMLACGERVLTQKALREFLQSMEHYWASAADWGRMNAVYPNGDGARDIPDFTQAYLVWVWDYYLQTGDKIFLQENYAKLKALADYVYCYRNDETGLIHRLRGGGGAYEFGIVDWTPSMRYGYDMDTDARTVVNAFAYADFEIVGNIAAAIGRAEDAELYRRCAMQLLDAINTRLVNADGVYVDGLYKDGTQSAHASQQANAFPLALGIVPFERRAAVLAQVKDLRMASGMVTVYWLLRALGETGAGEHLLELYTNAAWDGWANSLAQGATCTWESWDANLGGNFSQSHPWGAIGLYGIQQYVLGVKPLAPQHERVQIKPVDFGQALGFARGRVPTERGEIAVEWERTGEVFTMRVELPVNVEAWVYVPGGDDAGAKVIMDGMAVAAARMGNYFWHELVGSGTHTIQALYAVKENN